MTEENRLAFEKNPSSCSTSPRREKPERSPSRPAYPYPYVDSRISADPHGHRGRIRPSSWDDSDDNLPPASNFPRSRTSRIYTSDDRKPKKSVFSEINELKKEFFKAREKERETEGNAPEKVRTEPEKNVNYDRRQTPGRIRRRSRSSGSSSPVGTPAELETQVSPQRTNKSIMSDQDHLPDISPKAQYDATYYLNNFFTELKSRRISMMDPISVLESVENEMSETGKERNPEEGDGFLCKTSRKLSQILEVEESRKDFEKAPEEKVSSRDLFQQSFEKPEENEFTPPQTAGSITSEQAVENPEEEKTSNDSCKSQSSEYLRFFQKSRGKSKGSLSERTPKFFEQGLDTDFIILSAKAAKTELNAAEYLDDRDDTTLVQLFSLTANGPDTKFSDIQNAEKNTPQLLTIDLMKLIASEDTTPRTSTGRSEHSHRTNSGSCRRSYKESPQFLSNIERDSARYLKLGGLNMLDSQTRDVSEQCDAPENDPELKMEEPFITMLKSPSLHSPPNSSKVEEEVTNRSKCPSSRRTQVKKKKPRSSMDSDRSVQASDRHSQVISYRSSERTHRTSRTPRSPGKCSLDSDKAPDSPISKSSQTSKSPDSISPKAKKSEITERPRSKKISGLNLGLDISEKPENLSHRSSKSVGTITRDSDRSGTKSSIRREDRSQSSRSRRKENAESRNSSPPEFKITPTSISGRSRKPSSENQNSERLEDTLRAAFSEQYRSRQREHASPPLLKLTSRTGSSGSRRLTLDNQEELLNFEKSPSRKSRSRHREHSDSRSPFPFKERANSGSSGKSKDSLGNREEFVNLENLRETSSKESEKVGDTASNPSSVSSRSKLSSKEVEMPDQLHSHRSEGYNPEPATVERERLSRSRNSSRTSVGSNFTEMDSPVRSTTKSRPNSYTSKGPYETLTQEPISGTSSRSVTYEDEDQEEINSTQISDLGDDRGRIAHKRLSVINEVSFEDLEPNKNSIENEENEPSKRRRAKGIEKARFEIKRSEEDEWNELIDKFKWSPNSIVLENFPGFPRPEDKSRNSMVEHSDKNSISECGGNAALRSRLRERMAKSGERIEKLEESFKGIDLAHQDPLLVKTKEDGFNFLIPHQIYHVNVEKGGPFGIGEFGDVPRWNAGDFDPKDLEKPKEHGDGVPSKRILEGLAPVFEQKESELKRQPRDDFQESTPLLFSEVQQDSDFAHLIQCRVKTSKSDNCINRKVSERQILPNSFSNRYYYKSDEMDPIESEENRHSAAVGKCMSKSTINQNTSSESLGFEKEWENLELDFERTPRLSRSLSNLDLRLQCHRDQCETFSISGSELFKSFDLSTAEKESIDLNKREKDKTKLNNWLKLRHSETKYLLKSGKRAKTKFRKRGSPSPRDYLISSKKGRSLVPELKLRNPNCFQNFYKRFISVFCLTSASSAATSK